MKIFYNGKCIKPMSESKTMESKSKGILIAKYKFDCSKADLFPEFNEGFEYTFIDEQIQEKDVMGVNVETIILMTYDARPDSNGVLTTEVAVEEPVLLNADNIITRSIYSTELPTKMQFGSDTVSNNRALSLLELLYANTSNMTSMGNMFDCCRNLIKCNTNNWDTSKVTNMQEMFDECSLLTSLDLSNWDVSNVTNMRGMLYGCRSLKSIGDLSNWVVSNVTDISWIFSYCELLTSVGNLSNWQVGNVTDMSGMFYGCKSLTSLDLTNWDTNNTIYMYDMFACCHNLKSILGIKDLNVSNVTDILEMFWACIHLTSLDLSNWDTSNVIDMSYMFCDCESLETLKLNNWHISNNTSIDEMFSPYDYTGCPNLTYIEMQNSDRNSIDKIIEVLPNRVGKEKGIIDFFNSENSDRAKVGDLASINWDYKATLVASYTAKVSGVKPTIFGFLHTKEEKLIDNVYHTNIYGYCDFDNCSFEGCKDLLTVDYLKITNKVTSAKKMFSKCYNLKNINTNGWDTSNITDMQYMFFSCWVLTTLDVNDFDVSNVINMEGMFDDCYSLISLDLSKWNTSKVENMGWMFYECYDLTSLNISNFDTSNVTDMCNMLYYCYSLTTLDLSNFDTSKVENTEWMFGDCSSLTTLNLSNWNINNVTSSDDMFDSCMNLKEVLMNNSDYNSVNTVISWLPTKSQINPSTLIIARVDDISKVDIETAESKFWSVKTSMLIAKYTANASGVVPTFNEGYQYTVNETNSNGIYTVELYSDTDFTSCNFYGKANLLTVEYLRVTKNVTNMYKMFYDCIRLTSIDLSKWDTSKVTNTAYMFYQCYNLASLVGIENWNTSNVTIMESMFESCESLASLNLNNWDVSKVTNMSYMFYFCSGLEHLYVSNWDVSNVTDMSYMFYCCDHLSELDFSRWDVSNVINMELLFCNCCSFSQNTVDGLRNWDVSNVGYMSAMIDCLCMNDVTTIDLSDWDVSNVIDMSYMLEYNTELKYLNLNNWILNEKVDTTELFLKSNNLERVSIMNSNAFTINKIIAELPTRTNNSIGTLIITGVDNISKVNIEIAKSKYWNVI